MEQNTQNELQEMREQLGLLHAKLEDQTIIEDTQIKRIPHMKITSIQAVSTIWLVLAIVALVFFIGMYGAFYFGLTHFDKMIAYAEKNYISPLDSLTSMSPELLSPELQERLADMSPKQLEEIKAGHAMFKEKVVQIKEEMQKDPERMQEAIEGVKGVIFGGWMLVLNILITCILIAVIVAQIFNIRVLRRGKIQENMCSLTEQIRKVRAVHLISCIVVTMLMALLMPLVLEFYEDLAIGWKVVLICLPAVMALMEILQLTPLRSNKAVGYMDWGRFFYIRHTCDKIISKMEE